MNPGGLPQRSVSGGRGVGSEADFALIEKLADKLGPTAGWPTQISMWADVFAEADPRFEREKFISRATNAWEQEHQFILDDEIPW